MYRLYICPSLVCLLTESVFLHLQAIHKHKRGPGTVIGADIPGPK